MPRPGLCQPAHRVNGDDRLAIDLIFLSCIIEHRLQGFKAEVGVSLSRVSMFGSTCELAVFVLHHIFCDFYNWLIQPLSERFLPVDRLLWWIL